MRKAKRSGTTKKSVSSNQERSNKKKRIVGLEKLTQMIMNRAYFIWEEKGQPDGQEWETCFQAEKEIFEEYKLN